LIHLEQPKSTRDVSLQWEESHVPPTYVVANGPCRVAAFGREGGRSIAVAASRGLCVLDLSRRAMNGHTSEDASSSCSDSAVNRPHNYRWKIFNNVKEEQRFNVVQMAWWERYTNSPALAGASDDLLLAVVKYANNDVPHLVCWSRRRCVPRSKEYLASVVFTNV
jgi:hypothetical protein